MLWRVAQIVGITKALIIGEDCMILDSAVFYSNNIEVITAFYRDVMGMEIEYQSGDKYVSLLFENGVRLGIKKAVDEREVPGMQTIFVGVADIDESYRKYKEIGVTFYKELTEESWGKQFSILDPDSNKVLFNTLK
ncbi:MAG: VOC family protein [bacterium]|nr:VOC family protein [bacterium]